jgi:predicted TIM-barrel fold metal-dependent hydrolase
MLDGPVIDACAFHEWANVLTLLPYLPAGTAQLLTREGDVAGPMNVKSQWRYQDPRGNKLLELAPPSGGPPGSNLDTLAEHLLADGQCDRVVLGCDDGILVTAYPLPHLARQVVRAVNDWTVNDWLERDERLYAHVLVLASQPEEAAAEIRRIGSHNRIVAVALGINALDMPFGHPVYRQIFDAAVEMDLPIVLQSGVDASADTAGIPVAAGLPTTYAAYDTMRAQGMMSHAITLIMSGIFNSHPNLRVQLMGGGIGWVPIFLWRSDYQFKITRKVEGPWLDGLPSDYFKKHFFLSTQGLENPRDPARLAQMLQAVPNVASTLMYTSAYPDRSFERPQAIADRLPESMHQGVFRDNAEQFFRWPGTPRTRSAVAVAAG